MALISRGTKQTQGQQVGRRAPRNEKGAERRRRLVQREDAALKGAVRQAGGCNPATYPVEDVWADKSVTEDRGQLLILILLDLRLFGPLVPLQGYGM